MKVKQLKDMEFSYIPEGGREPGDFKTHFEIRQEKRSTFLTKREALSFIKWALKEGDWTLNQARDIEIIAHEI